MRPYSWVMEKMHKFMFLDRDGVINRDPGAIGKSYVTAWDEFTFLPGAIEALKTLKDKGYAVAIVSNQAGIKKGFYKKEELDSITKKMLGKIEESGGRIDSVQYCLHTSGDNCDCRKPKTGLFKKATKGVNIDFSKTYLIGDTKSDMEAGRNIGCRTILVLSGKTKDANEAAQWEVKPDFIKKDLREAVDFILKKGLMNGKLASEKLKAKNVKLKLKT